MFVLTSIPNIGSNFISELRDAQVQKDSLRFRFNMQRVGELLAYEISKKLEYIAVSVQTPLGNAKMNVLSNQPILVTILRAGLPFHDGFLRMFDRSSSAFVGSFRGKYKPDHSFNVEMKYLTSPSIAGQSIIIIDPMLATGKSLISAIHSLFELGTPNKLFIAAAIASQQGIDYVQKELPMAELFIGDIDPELNDKYYIVPGLGDAGDLSFGPKL